MRTWVRMILSAVTRMYFFTVGEKDGCCERSVSEAMATTVMYERIRRMQPPQSGIIVAECEFADGSGSLRQSDLFHQLRVSRIGADYVECWITNPHTNSVTL